MSQQIEFVRLLSRRMAVPLAPPARVGGVKAETAVTLPATASTTQTSATQRLRLPARDRSGLESRRRVRVTGM
jgi:hypothetical protein